MQTSAIDPERIEPEDAVLATFDRENFEFSEIRSRQDRQGYIDLLEKTYRELGFLEEFVYPRPEAALFDLTFRGQTAGICALTPSDGETLFHRLIPAVRGNGRHAKVLELTNAIIAPQFHGSIALGLLLSECAQYSWRNGYDYVAGVVRAQVLRAFVDFGVVPVEHAPLHLLGRSELNDFVVYYDTHSPESIIYMRERTARYCHQKFVLEAIKRKHLQPQAPDRNRTDRV